MCQNGLPCASPSCQMAGKQTFFKVTKEDVVLIERYALAALNYLDGEIKTIHRAWLEEDFPSSPCVESFLVDGEWVRITWKAGHEKYLPIVRNVDYKDGITIKYVPSREALYFDSDSFLPTKLEGKAAAAYLDVMKEIVDYRESLKGEDA